jgi:hypothetical protein
LQTIVGRRRVFLTFAPSVSLATGNIGNILRSIVVGDFSGDNRTDLATGNYANNTIVMFLGYGKGSVEMQIPISSISYPVFITVGDFNGDLKADLAIVRFNKRIGVLMSHSGGMFGPQMSFPVGFYPATVAVSDINGDNNSDFAVTSEDSNTVSVFLGYGNGNFDKEKFFSTGTSPQSMATIIWILSLSIKVILL